MMSVSALDSRIFRNLFGTQAIRDVFADSTYVQHMINVEAALTRAQSKTGVIPSDIGASLTEALNSVNIE